MRVVDRVLEAAGNSAAGIFQEHLKLPTLYLPEYADSSRWTCNLASIPLVIGQVAMQVSLVARWDVYREVVRVMLNADPTETIDDADVADGIGEVMNLVAGKIKEQLNPDYPRLSIGLPTVSTADFNGSQSRLIATASQPIGLGIHDAMVLVMVRSEVADDSCIS